MKPSSGRILIPVVLLAVLILAVGIGTESSFGKSFTPQKLTIIFSGDDLGNLKPCG